MSVEIRSAEPDELLAGLAPIWHYFGASDGPAEERAQRIVRVLPEGRLHLALDDGSVVGSAGAFSFNLTVPGARVPTAGVTVVGVLPTHRRRGILRELMRTQIEDVRRRGEPLAALWASEGTIYGRFGYGLAALCGDMALPREHGRYAVPFALAGSLRLVSLAEASEILPPVYERVAAVTPGMFSREPGWWESRVLSDPEWRRGGAGELTAAVLETGSGVVGYALYRLELTFGDAGSTGTTHVVEAMGATPEAEATIWRYLLDVDWMATVKAWLLPVDHPLFLLLPEPARMRFNVGDGLWLRLVDVEAALGARAYAPGEEVVLGVRDSVCPWNEGAFRVAPDGVERTDAEAEIQLGAGDLAGPYLGGFTFGQLARAGRIEVLAEDAVERADALFRPPRAPWCPEIF